MPKKEFKICYMRKAGNLPEGYYAFKKPNIWYPVLYFRKAKHATEKEFQIIKEFITNNP